MNNIIEPNWKDKILSGVPKYRMRKNNEIIQDDFTLEQITPSIQEPTPLNKLNLETPIGEIRLFSNERNDNKYLLCDGSRIYLEDYPELSVLLPKKYTYDTLQLDTAYGEVTQVSYFPQKNIYIMVRKGVKDSLGFGIFTSEDAVNWVLRYTSASQYYAVPPTIYFIDELNIFGGVGEYTILSSSDGYNWTLGKSLSYSGSYEYAQPTFVQFLGKVLITQYDTESSYTTTLYATTNFINFETLCTKSGSASEVFFTKVIEENGKLYASGQNLYAPYIAFVSTDNGKTFASISNSRFDANRCVKFGEYWYSQYRTSSNVGATVYINRTKDFETFTTLGSAVDDTSLIGIVNGFLFYRINGVLTRRDLNDNAVTFEDVGNFLGYFEIRKEYVKIMDKELYCSKDLVTWAKYDDMPETGVITALFNCSNGEIFARPATTADYLFTYNEKQINLPNIDFCFAYIKAYLNESEG